MPEPEDEPVYEPLTDAEVTTLLELFRRATGGLQCAKPCRNEPRLWIEEIHAATVPAFKQIVDEARRRDAKIKQFPQTIYPK